MPPNRTHRRLAAALATAALLVPPFPVANAGTSAHETARPARVKTDSVSISIADVQPAILPTDSRTHPFTVTLSVTNRTDRELTGLTIDGERGEPINTQSQFDQAVKHVGTPTGSVEAIKPKTPVILDLAGNATQVVQFRSTTSTINTDGGLCNCTNPELPALIYPLYFTAHVPGPGGVDQSLGLARTFVTAFLHAPAAAARVQVSWVWPLVDQPHLLDDTPVGPTGPVFTDDSLAASVGTGGRLEKALAVAEQVAQDPDKPPLTLLVDPELLDELQLMSSGPYEVQTGKTRTPGGGGTVATDWLQRFRTLLDATQIHLQLTPYADPDVDSLQAAGLGWSAGLPAAMQQRVEEALGRPVAATTLAWPAAGTIGRATLGTLVQQGVGTVLLNGSAIAPKPASGSVRSGLARLSVDGRDVAVGVLDQTLQKYVQQSVTAGKADLGSLALLTAELTIRAVVEPAAEHVAVLAPPRWVDADVATAVRVIESTSDSLATASIGLDTAVAGQLLPIRRSHLASGPPGAPRLPAGNLAVIQRATQELPGLTAVFTPRRPAVMGAQPKAVLDAIPIEEQRIAASGWGRPGFGASAGAFGQRLLDRLDQLTNAVTIVAKAGSSYTLASKNSPFPLTVRNTLPWPVTVEARVDAAGGLGGFTANPKTATVEANQKASIKLSTEIERSGRFRVIASLYTPDESAQAIGDPVDLTVRSTALGAVGVIITVGAGAVLVLALLIRFGRRLRHRWSSNGNGRPRWDPDAPDAELTFAETMRQREAKEAQKAEKAAKAAADAAAAAEPAAERAP